MPRNGSGTYTLPAGNPVVTGTTISSTVQNNTMSDVASALTQSLTKNGETVPTANLPMGGFRHTGVANAQNRTDYASSAQVQDSSFHWLTSVTGTDTITASLSAPLLAAYAAGQTFRFISAGANTTNAVTLNINGLGAKSVSKFGALALSKGNIRSGAVVQVTYDGTEFQVSSIIPAQGAYSSRGLVGFNNASLPASKMDFSADETTVCSPTTNEAITILSTGTITNDTGATGPAANARDQASAFPNDSWVYFYFIWNGQTLATISSLAAPPTGPTLPSGYTHWSYICSNSLVGTTFNNIRLSGKTVFYSSAQTVLSGGGAIVQTAVSLSAFVPPNAVDVKARIDFYGTSDGSGNLNMSGYIRHTTGNDYFRTDIGPIGGLSATTLQRVSGPAFIELPNVSQNLYYLCSPALGTGPSMNISVQAYTIPNGN